MANFTINDKLRSNAADGDGVLIQSGSTPEGALQSIEIDAGASGSNGKIPTVGRVSEIVNTLTFPVSDANAIFKNYVDSTKTVYFNLNLLTASTARTITVPDKNTTLHDAITLDTANGLLLAGQALSLVLASTSATGALSSTDWNTFNGKQNALGFTPPPNTLTINGHALTGNITVTATDVGNGVAQWNANKIKSILVDDSAIANGATLVYNSTSGNLEFSTILPSLKIGNATNYIEMGENGHVTMYGTARVKKAIKIFTASEMQRGVSPPSSGILGNVSFEKYTIGDDSVLNLAILNEREAGSDIEVVIRWACEEAYSFNNAEVQWQVEWCAIPDDGSEAVDAPTYCGTVKSGDVNVPAIAKSIKETTIIIPGTNILNTDELGFVLKRIALDDGNDPATEPGIIILPVLTTNNKFGENL